MSTPRLETESLTLTLPSLEESRAQVEAMSAADKAEVSPEWLKLLYEATTPDPWVVGFTIVQKTDEAVVGGCGFKGPPTSDATAEIAYAVESEFQGRGYATEAAQALVSYAFQNGVRVVRAHTLPESNASTRVLTKCGFDHIGEVVDPEDGLVWRWEKSGDKE